MTGQPSSSPRAGRSGPTPHFLEDPVLDGIIEVCMQLGGELWSTRARLARLERLLEVDGRPVGELLEQQTGLEEEEREAWVAERDRFVTRIFGALARHDHQPAGEVV